MQKQQVHDENGVKVIVEYKEDENGRKIKVTRKIRMVLTKQKANHAIAERKRWSKFGSAKAATSFDDGTTTLAEEVKLNLSLGGKNQQQQEVKPQDVKKVQNTTIICRICKGDHWTTKCPYKDTLQPLEELMDKGKPSSTEAKPAAKPDGPAKYVPPSLRGGPRPSGEGARSSRYGDDLPCIRVSSISEEATERDMHQLFDRFGPISRLFLATDRDTGRCKGFAFITYRSRQSAQKAIDVMNGYGFDNLILSVEWSKRD